MKSELPLVSVITVNRNQSLITCEFLKSIHLLTYHNVEVIVVDNASDSDDPSIIEHQFPRIKLIRNQKTMATASCINLGISIARGKYLLILDNHTELTPNFAEPLINFFKENPEAGIISPKVRSFSKPDLILYAGYTPLHPITVQNRPLGYKEKDTGQHDMIIETPYIHRSAMMIPSEVAKKAGSIPDLYFICYEEMDWSERIKEAGYKIFYYPNSVTYLKKTNSIPPDDPLLAYYKNRNRLLFTRRNYKGKYKFLALIYLYCIAVPKSMFVYLIRGKIRFVWALAKGVWWNLLTFNIYPINKYHASRTYRSN